MAKSRIVANHEVVVHEVVPKDKKTIVHITHPHRLTILTILRVRPNSNVPYAEPSNACPIVQLQAVDNVLDHLYNIGREVQQGPTVPVVHEAHVVKGVPILVHPNTDSIMENLLQGLLVHLLQRQTQSQSDQGPN